MSNQKQFRKNKATDDSDFDLDQYLEAQTREQRKAQLASHEIEDEPSYWFRNILIVSGIVAASFMWVNDWNVNNAYNSLFGNTIEQSTVINTPAPNAPDVQPLLPSGNQSVIDYLAELKEKGLLSDDKLSAFAAREIYSAGVPIAYLEELDQAGYLSDFSFVYINEFHNNNIPTSYLNALDEAGYLEEFSFVEIIEFYKNNVSFEYLNKLNESGYLEDLSFVHIVEYYKNGVTTEYLDVLKAKGLYDNLSFVDVVELYKTENN